jgi:DNA repair protein RecO (recombination protein O)
VPLVAARALVLQTYPYSDTSKILRLFTRDFGLRSAIAKGALRPKSRYGGILEPFTEGDALLYLKDGRDLQTLAGFDLVRSRQALGRDLAAFAGASLVAELLLRFTTEEPNPLLYGVACEALDRIVSAEGMDETERIVLSSAWSIVSLLGFRPETESCVRCGRAMDALEPVRFDVEGGGIACTVCRPAGRVLDSQSRNEVRRMADGEILAAPFARRSVQQALLRAFVTAHLRPAHPLRSLDLFVEHLA